MTQGGKVWLHSFYISFPLICPIHLKLASLYQCVNSLAHSKWKKWLNSSSLLLYHGRLEWMCNSQTFVCANLWYKHLSGVGVSVMCRRVWQWMESFFSSSKFILLLCLLPWPFFKRDRFTRLGNGTIFMALWCSWSCGYSKAYKITSIKKMFHFSLHFSMSSSQ